MIKKKNNRFALYSKKKNESFSEKADASTDAQAAISNSSANKKNKEFGNDRSRMNKTDIECYNCHDKDHDELQCHQKIHLSIENEEA